MSLDAFTTPGQFFRGNIHTHSTNSDGALSPEAVCSFYREAGYDFLMLSDHFLPQYDFPVTDTRDFRTRDFTTIIGAEIHAPATQHGELWHVVAAGLPLDFEPTGDQEQAHDLTQRAFEAGAFIGLAHPAWSGMSVDEARAMEMAHAIEIFNYGCARETDRADGFYILDALSNEGRKLSGYATDDAHFHIADHLGAWMNVKADSRDPEALVEAMKAGHYYSSEGPEFHMIGIEGDEIVVECSPVRNIALIGRGQKSRVQNGADRRSARFSLSSFTKDWCRVVAIDEAGRRAWSNPIWT